MKNWFANFFLNKTNELVLVGLGYVLVASVLLFSTLQGVGQYWDWSFPYYSSQLHNYFDYKSYSWSQVGFGNPIGYNSDYFFRFLVSLMHFLQPEYLRFFYNTTLLFLASFFTYLIVRRHTGFFNSFLAGMVVIANPAVFYKVLSGHFNYLFSYALVIMLVYYLVRYFKGTIKDGVAVGILYGMSGAQIQFFLFTAIIMIFFALFKKSMKTFFVMVFSLILGFILNYYWLSNFFLSQDLATTAASAKAVSFASSLQINPLSIFLLSFSKATLIVKFFHPFVLWGFALFFFAIVVTWLRKKNSNFFEIYYFKCLMLFFISFSLYSSFISLLPGAGVLAPMFREVGHVSPLIVVFAILAIEFSSRSVYINRLVQGVLLFVIIFSGISYFTMLPAFSFDAMRQQLNPFKEYSDTLKGNASSRFLMYPYYKPFGIKTVYTRDNNGFLLNNAGGDSFSTFGDVRFVSTIVPPQDLKNSIQYSLHTLKDATFLRLFSISNIYDLSTVYDSYLDKFIPSSIYNGDESLIKVSKGYLSHIIGLKQYSKDIYTVENTNPYIYTSDNLTEINAPNSIFSLAKIANTKMLTDSYAFSNDILGKTIAQKYTAIPLNLDNESIIESVDPSKQKSFFSKESPAAIFDVNNQGLVYENIFYDSADSRYLLYPDSYQIDNSNDNSLSVSGSDMESSEYKLDSVVKNTVTFKSKTPDNKNIIANGSFEDGLWKKDVQDCYNHDDNPDISMELDRSSKTDGNASLRLSARRHIACTGVDFPIQSLDPLLLLSFDYQVNNENSEVGYFLQFNDALDTVVKGRFKSEGVNGWYTYTKFFSMPSNATSVTVYFYAYQSDDETTENIVHYDNISLLPTPSVRDLYVIKSNSTSHLQKPKSVNFVAINPTRKEVSIKGGTSPFYLTMAENYHDKWIVELNNNDVNLGLNRWIPLVRAITVDNRRHFKINSFLNGWYIDPVELCGTKENLKEGCIINSDGSYDIEMIIEFTPQRWFYVGLIISGTTLLSCLTYLTYSGIRGRRARNIERALKKKLATERDLNVAALNTLPNISKMYHVSLRDARVEHTPYGTIRITDSMNTVPLTTLIHANAKKQMAHKGNDASVQNKKLRVMESTQQRGGMKPRNTARNTTAKRVKIV